MATAPTIKKPRATKAKPAPVAPAETQIVAYKGFDKNLQCRGYQFEVGKTFEHTGRVEACAAGFHSCEDPMDVLSYYGIGDDNRFCRVTVGGEISRHGGDSKIASGKITIEAELRLPDFIKAAVTWMMSGTAIEAKAVTGKATGDLVQSSSGYSSQLAASGDYSKLAASGDYSKLAASGYSSQLAASGDYSQLAASGDSSKLAASGYYSKLAASGDYSKLAASGYYSKLAASGDSSKLAASGDYSQLAASGDYSVIASVAPGCTATGVAGTWVSLAEFGHDGKCIGFATGCIGQDGLEANKAYIARGGKLVSA